MHIRLTFTFAMALVGLTLAAASCGDSAGAARLPCVRGPEPYLEALRGAPRRVRLPGGLPISDCLAQSGRQGGLRKVGAAITAAFNRLRSEGLKDPKGDAPLELGFLMGAAWRGGEARPQGIPASLLHPLTHAAELDAGGKPVPLPFLLSYTRGFNAAFHAG